MIVKMLTHLHMVVIFGGVGTFAKEKLCVIPFPSYRACEAGFGEVSEVKQGSVVHRTLQRTLPGASGGSPKQRKK